MKFFSMFQIEGLKDMGSEFDVYQGVTVIATPNSLVWPQAKRYHDKTDRNGISMENLRRVTELDCKAMPWTGAYNSDAYVL
jgi:hypothetical protein